MIDHKMTIYNIFPRYYQSMSEWAKYFVHIKEMGFNTIFINPIHYPGLSNSLYAPKNYFSINPEFTDSEDFRTPIEQFENIIQEIHRKDMKIIMDLVINHSSIDHPFVLEHPEWYLKDKNNNIVHPGAWEDGQWICWGDLAQFNHVNSIQKDELWQYFEHILIYYIKLGVDGFRVDSAYQAPMELWEFLINKIKEIYPDIFFIAENLGCRLEDSQNLVKSGFDYLYNSAKWWNFEDDWFVEQYNILSPMPSIAFPESHDTNRIAGEKDNNQIEIQKSLVFTGLISSGWMILTGTEFGWLKKPNVSTTRPSDQEEININFSSIIFLINKLRDIHPILNSEGLIFLKNSHPEVLIIEKKWINSEEKIYFVINQTNCIQELSNIINLESAEELISSYFGISTNINSFSLHPKECKVFYSRQ